MVTREASSSSFFLFSTLYPRRDTAVLCQFRLLELRNRRVLNGLARGLACMRYEWVEGRVECVGV